MSGKDAKSVKVSDVSLDQFVQFVQKKDEALFKKCVEAKLDIVPVVKNIKEDVVADLTVLSGVVKAVSAVRAALEMALATEVSCYFLGMKDNPRSKGPATALFLRLSEGGAKGTKATLFEANTFDPKIEMPDGTKKKLESMGKVVLKLKENTKYETFEVVQLVSYEEVSTERMGELLVGVINDPRKFTDDDKYKPIVLLGNIRGIYPVSILAKNDDDEWKPIGEYPIKVRNLLEEDPVDTPVFRVGLEPISGVTVRVSFDPRKFTEPILDVADLAGFIDAAARDIKSPKDQTINVGELLAERDVLVVGSVQRVSTNKSGSTYMEVSAFSMIDAPQKINWFENGTPAAAAPPSTPAAAPSTAPAAPVAAPAASPAAAPTAAEKSPKKGAGKKGGKDVHTEDEAAAKDTTPSDVKPVTKFEEVKAAIVEYCDKLKMKPAQLTIEMVKEQICPSAKEGTIEAALDEINSP
jgi:hypothetical protein